jgi:hypothetical protein
MGTPDSADTGASASTRHSGSHSTPHVSVHVLARRSLLGFIVTFVLARSFVFLIMAHRVPNMYFFLHGTHVHHLNYGIFLLGAVGGYSVFRRPVGLAAEIAALLYGVAMALTFDEFGMWLHLGGSYWQRTSVDGVVVIAAVIALIGYAPSIRRLEARHFWEFSLAALAVIAFGWAIWWAGGRLGQSYGPALRELEESSSP